MDESKGYTGKFIIKDENQKSLFTILISKEHISFNDGFLKGIIENESTFEFYEKLNQLPEESNKKEESLKIVTKMIEENQEYLNQFSRKFLLKKDKYN